MIKKEKIQIGNLKLKNRIFLAPMHKVNDIAFRLLCKKAGAGLTYTGLINPQTKQLLYFQDRPAVQFACNSDKKIKDFIKKYDSKIALYDFNLGCPSPHAKDSKIGYFMHEDIKNIEKILKKIKENTKKPITLKIRKVSDNSLRNIIKIAEKYCSAISVHPRTQQQGYSGVPDLEFARWVKKLTKLPIIYSGNINNKEEAAKLLLEFDFIMIGRASMGNPGIFAELTEKKSEKKVTFFDWLKLYKKIDKDKYFSQIKFQAINFTRDFEGAGKTRRRLSMAKTEEEITRFFINRKPKCL
jgi:tRNA-dihydrouridine synthase